MVKVWKLHAFYERLYLKNFFRVLISTKTLIQVKKNNQYFPWGGRVSFLERIICKHKLPRTVTAKKAVSPPANPLHSVGFFLWRAACWVAPVRTLAHCARQCCDTSFPGDSARCWSWCLQRLFKASGTFPTCSRRIPGLRIQRSSGGGQLVEVFNGIFYSTETPNISGTKVAMAIGEHSWEALSPNISLQITLAPGRRI